MNTEVFALLDDASPEAALSGGRSRLYTGHTGTLRCDDIAAWPQLLEQMQAALARGEYAVTVCAYELGEALLALTPPAAAPRSASAPASAPMPPLARVLLFRDCALLSSTEVGDWLAARSFPIDRPAGVANIQPNIDQEAFSAALARIHDYIAAGDTYQVNYTFRLRFDTFGGIHALYARLRGRQPVPYGALIALDDGSAVLSLSPELFVRHADGELTARPMKGTAPAAPPKQQAENILRATNLAADPKNRAENLMIVDLLRNDIARVAVTGSVDVPALFEVHRYASVLQMTSTITARQRDDVTLADIFDALYPCGSITGAPKRRTMEIIRELEPDARGIYTGAIGWFDPRADGKVGNFCMSVPIRTLTLQPPGADGVQRGEMGVGAGIVFDSDASAEYAECQLKARFLTGLQHDFELFETMRATPAGGVRHRARHLKRLAASAAYFGFPWDENAAAAYLDTACAMLEPQHAAYRLRLALSDAGAFSVQHAPLTPLAEPVRVLLAEDHSSSADLFLRHKTSIRQRYDAAWRDAEAQGAFDTLFFNERGELTEGGRSNVFVRINGQWLTPPLSAGVLPGVMRGVLLDDPDWHASEAVITRAMLDSADEIILCNALRGALRATLA
ncbi:MULTISPECIES: aminodeoxychorismate synthase component I [unclassified Duganella]|uniref:aminodeoxychorismate synthase component I n=1 Tax=unclassified Duganella TaxID=2636909 RepID=UPI00088967AA|nr:MULTISPECIES: aminodeoxychorismate synthase component I [unclassified Duganella]SDG90886.1 para-aminobenzoate synthetase / 4-amino-4-deoxychorismate lyase [Duganella sp. OV458]SDJ51458.1 para-aminobenzoate synthetase / 4-amino-4-deoxychorismate lyase [Duganella sp. OV510]